MYPKNIIPEKSFNYNPKLLLSKLKTINISLIAILVLSVHSVSSAHFIALSAGESYTLNDNTYSSDNLFVYGQLNSILNITSGASIDYIYTSQNFTVNMKDGSINRLLAIGPTINFSGGSIENAWIYGTSKVIISGGSISGAISSGGHATIYLEGDNFKVNGQSVSYGDKLSKYGTSITVTGTTESDTGTIKGTWAGKYINITGTLADGSPLNTNFYFVAAVIDNKLTATESEVIIVPEPAAIALLSIGGLLLRRRTFKACKDRIG